VKKIKWWVWALILSLPLPVLGFLWNPKKSGYALLIGGGIILFAGFGDLVAPSANQTAYYDTRTGRRTTSTGKPYYSIHEDIQKYGKIKGFLWFLCKTYIPASLLGAYIGMVIFGIYAIIKIILFCGRGDPAYFFRCIGRIIVTSPILNFLSTK
jgi:hypothetical protein